MAANQAQTNNDVRSFYQFGEPLEEINETILQDAGRSGDLVAFTLMAYNPTSAKWVPFTNEAATDGTAYPAGFVTQTYTEAAIIAGDIVDVPIIVGGLGLGIDKNRLVIENSKTLDTIINVPTNMNTTVEQALRRIGIFVSATSDATAPQNA
jgi:hypothetical protein